MSHKFTTIGKPRPGIVGKRRKINFALTIEAADWIRSQAHALKVTESEIVRRCVDASMASSKASKETTAKPARKR